MLSPIQLVDKISFRSLPELYVVTALLALTRFILVQVGLRLEKAGSTVSGSMRSFIACLPQLFAIDRTLVADATQGRR